MKLFELKRRNQQSQNMMKGMFAHDARYKLEFQSNNISENQSILEQLVPFLK